MRIEKGWVLQVEFMAYVSVTTLKDDRLSSWTNQSNLLMGLRISCMSMLGWSMYAKCARPDNAQRLLNKVSPWNGVTNPYGSILMWVIRLNFLLGIRHWKALQYVHVCKNLLPNCCVKHKISILQYCGSHHIEVSLALNSHHYICNWFYY